MADTIESTAILNNTRRRHWPRRGESGQGIVEFALTFPLALVVILMVIELGFGLSAYVNVVWAAREGARLAALYEYDTGCTVLNNNQNRESGSGGCSPSYPDNVRDVVERSLGWLQTSPPNFNKADPSSPGPGITISYEDAPIPPDGIHPDSKSGDRIVVTVTYHYRWLSQVLSNATITLSGKGAARIE